MLCFKRFRAHQNDKVLYISTVYLAITPGRGHSGVADQNEPQREGPNRFDSVVVDRARLGHKGMDKFCSPNKTPDLMS